MNSIARKLNGYLAENQIKKVYIAERLGLTRQGLSNHLNKKNFTVEDANKILEMFGMTIEINIVPK